MDLGILWWLAPPVVVTLVAIAWVTWAGKARGSVDPEVAAERMARALRKEHPGQKVTGPAATRPRDRSTGIAVRPSRGE
ncbi:hypothetical protein [Nocardioides jiangxiensis]|uniref:Uncharacterized protein n=1 Tax=Nocardioides jiangxiensis TaxID=3064524 RepID=A0ABT9AXX5_9ACTN|nr:hypothetical protein [Nocardioides sp. WY-20]MDO7867417.1 hypothetical protein [Nocardioides sp. WY-20]